jgi:hypothetical protein
MLTLTQSVRRFASIATHKDASGVTPTGAPYDATEYRLALVNLVHPVVSGHVSALAERDLPTWEDEKNSTRFPSLNRRGSSAGRYTIKASALPNDLTSEQYEEWQDRLTMLRQFAKLAGISINGKDYSKVLTVKAGKHASAKGAEFDVTHTSRWDGGRYDNESAKRSAAKLALARDRAIYPWLYDARGKRREPQIDKAGSVMFGPRGRGVTVADLMLDYTAKECAKDCATDTMARTIREAQYLRTGSTELDALISEQAADLKAQRRGKAMLTPIAELVG